MVSYFLQSPILNILKRVASYMSSLAVYVPPVVRECMWELKCLVTDSNLNKCGWHVIRCVSRFLTGITSCLYDFGGDVAINAYYHGANFLEYDYGRIILDVLSCAGLHDILKDLEIDVWANFNK